MSLTRCDKCDRIADTDEYPEGYYDESGNARDYYFCDNCNLEGE